MCCVRFQLCRTAKIESRRLTSKGAEVERSYQVQLMRAKEIVRGH
jgi:hypothetical protein